MTSPIVINIPGAKLLSSRGSGANSRQHHQARGREVRVHRSGANVHIAKAIGIWPGVAIFLDTDGTMRPSPSCKPRVRFVTLTRLCPRRFFCDGADNLRSLFKATLDGVADALGVNDKVFIDNPTESDIQSGKIGIVYEQIDGPWGVRITIESL